MYQRLILCGNLGRDPELRHTTKGDPVCSLSVAVNRRYKDKATGETRSRTTWFRVTTWGNMAEACAKHLVKGQQVLVEGEMLPAKPFESKSGQWLADLVVNASSITWGAKPKRDGQGAPGSPDDEEMPF